MQPQPTAARRRTSMPKHPGVYWRTDRAGRRVYEITYRDSSSKRRWETIAGGLRDADNALADRKGRMGRGERIVRTRATVAEVAATWLSAVEAEVRPRTFEKYEGAMRLHVLPRLGHRRISSISEDDIARLIVGMRESGKAGWTIRGTLVPLSRLLAFGVRRGHLPANPVARLERGERPRVESREQRILNRDEIGRLLAAALPSYRTLLATAAYTGLRLSELLGLVWEEVDFDAGFVRVRRQIDRQGNRVEPKTPTARRDVVLATPLAMLLREHRRTCRATRPTPLARERDFVFATLAGTPLGYRNVERRGLDRAANDAGLNPPGQPKLRLHDMRHSFASLLIAQGADVVHVSRQLGHAKPDITLRIYAHLFDAVAQADRTRSALDEAIGASLGADT